MSAFVARVSRGSLAAALVATLVATSFAQQPDWPTSWKGIVGTSLNADGRIAVMTLDREGGTFGDPSSSQPDGIVDWVFVLTYGASRLPELNGPATLASEPAGKETFLTSLSVVPVSGAKTTFVSAISNPGPGAVKVCEIIRLYPGPNIKTNHEDTAAVVLKNRWTNRCE